MRCVLIAVVIAFSVLPVQQLMQQEGREAINAKIALDYLDLGRMRISTNTGRTIPIIRVGIWKRNGLGGRDG